MVSTERDDDTGGGTIGPPESEHGERPNRRPRLAVVAVAAAVLVAGGGGAWWATADSGGGSSAHPAPLRMDVPGLSAPSTGATPAPTGGGAAPYRLTGKLPKGPDKAPVYGATGSVSVGQVKQLASLLGVPGSIRTVNGSWQVGANPGGSGPALMVSKAEPATWSYSRGGDPSTGTRSSGSDGSDGSGGSGGDPVSPAKAQAVAAPVFKGLGLSGAKVDASTAVGSVRTVSVDPVVGGLPTHGWTTTVEVGADGRTSGGFGRLGRLEKGDSYPVVSAATALKELNATHVMHPGAVSGCAQPAPSATSVPSLRNGGPKIVSPCLPGSGGAQPTEVRGASFGLALEYVSGVQTLVPAWLFDTSHAGAASSSVVAQTAVDPSYITTGPGGSATAVPPSSPGSPSVNPGGPIRPAPTSPSSPPSSGQGAVRHVQIESYRASGTTLTLSYEGGLCDTYKASASESSSQVRVSLIATAKPKGTMCPMIIKTFTQKVTLKSPLGGREVVDTSNGARVSSGS